MIVVLMTWCDAPVISTAMLSVRVPAILTPFDGGDSTTSRQGVQLVANAGNPQLIWDDFSVIWGFLSDVGPKMCRFIIFAFSLDGKGAVLAQMNMVKRVFLHDCAFLQGVDLGEYQIMIDRSDPSFIFFQTLFLFQ